MARGRLAAVALLVVGLVVAASALLTGEARRARSSRPTGEAPPPEPLDPLARLAAEVRDPDPDRRVEAAVELRALGERAVPVFVDLLRHGDAQGRTLAARSLGKMGPAATGAVSALVEATRDPALRLVAVEALGAIGDRGVAGALLPLLRESDPALVLAALKALEALKPDTAEAALAIAAVLDPANESPTNRASLDALEAMGAAAAAALPALLRAFESRELLSPAIEAIQAIGPDALPAVPALIAVIVDEVRRNEEERARALETIVDFPGYTSGPYPQYDAERALAAIGEGAIPQVLAILAHESEGVRESGRDILAGMGDPAVPHLVGAASHPDARIREVVAGALLKYAKGHPELVAVLARLTADADTGVRRKAIESLGAYGQAAEPLLLAALEETDKDLLLAAVDSLGRIGPKDPAAVPHLVRLLGHEDNMIRWNAADALAAMGDAAVSGIPALAGYLGDECPYMQEYAREALAKLGQRALPTLLDGLDRASPDAQRGTVVLLAARKDLSEEGRDACRRMLLSADEAVRVEAAAALAAHGAPEATLLPILVGGLAHREKETRAAAAAGLASLGDAAAPALPDILRAVARDDVQLMDAVAAAGKEQPKRARGRALGRILDVRYDAAVALERVGEKAVPLLVEALAKGPVDTRRAAAGILGRLAKGSVAARAALEAARADPDVRFAALEALLSGTYDARAVVPGYIDEALAGTNDSQSAAYRLSQIGSGAAFAIKELRAAHAAAKDAEVRTYLALAIEAIETR